MPTIQYHWRPAKAFKPGRSLPLSGIVIHSTDGGLEGSLDTLYGPKVSAHWLVDRDGSYWHLVDDSDTAYHAGLVFDPHWGNAGTIGVEQVHIDGAEPWPDVQVAAVGCLVAALEQHHGKLLPVKSHAEVAKPKGRKSDPASYPWAAFSNAVNRARSRTWTLEQIP